MGTYNLSSDEMIDSFEKWLTLQEGDVTAVELAKAWNKLSDQHGWNDYLAVDYTKEEEAEWAEMWREHMTMDMQEEGEPDLELLTDEKILEKIRQKLHDIVYYREGWNRICGGFADVAKLAVIEKDDIYHVHAVVKHGENDGEGSKTYEGEMDLEMNKDLEAIK